MARTANPVLWGCHWSRHWPPSQSTPTKIEQNPGCGSCLVTAPVLAPSHFSSFLYSYYLHLIALTPRNLQQNPFKSTLQLRLFLHKKPLKHIIQSTTTILFFSSIQFSILQNQLLTCFAPASWPTISRPYLICLLVATQSPAPPKSANHNHTALIPHDGAVSTKTTCRLQTNLLSALVQNYNRN